MSASQGVCALGVGTTEWGNFPDTDAMGLAASAFSRALAESGLDAGEIDGLITSRVPNYLRFSAGVGLDPTTTIALPAEGRQSGVALALAEDLINSGRCRAVALAYGNDGRSRRVYYGGETGGPFNPWGFTSLGALHAMRFREYMHTYGATHDQLAEIPVTFRYHASLNPQAVMRAQFGRADYHASRWIVEPLHLLDYCLINDGGVSLILGREDMAQDVDQPVVRMLASATSNAFAGAPFYPEDNFYASSRRCAEQVYARSGLHPEDMDALMIYDNFSPTVLFALEGFGFCSRGEAAEWVQGGRLRLGGQYPTNTSGGHLSESYMQGWALNVEAIRQLRGQAGQRQVPECRTVQYMASTPIPASIVWGVPR
jgi:acetyl-CoA acetyltransferase